MMAKQNSQAGPDSDPGLSRDVALRIALAARALPETEPARLLNVLEHAIGLPATASKLASLTVKSLKAAGDGELADIGNSEIKTALAFLKAEAVIDQGKNIPPIQSYEEGEFSDSIRVAFASNNAEELDGHFGSCARFLIYQISADEMRLIDVRQCNVIEAASDKNAYRANLIKDCALLFVASIGGPAAAKVVRAGVHPVKYADGGSTHERIKALQKVFDNAPPPWLAKAMGHNDESRVRFKYSAEN